jgi:hypothetical protein
MFEVSKTVPTFAPMKRTTETVKRNSETRSGYGTATIQWAEQMLLKGIAPADVARKTGIDSGYARTLKFRLKAKENADLLRPAREHDSDVLRWFAGLQAVSETETPVADAAPVAVSPTETPATETRKTAETARFKVPILETVFWTTTATACAGFFQAFQVWGLPVATVYTLILLDAMSMAKDIRLQKSAEQGAAAVIVLEMLAACAHTYVFNGLLWASYKSLPFTVKQSVVNGEIVWINGDKPFIIACVVACFLSGSAIYAVHLTIEKTRERAKK